MLANPYHMTVAALYLYLYSLLTPFNSDPRTEITYCFFFPTVFRLHAYSSDKAGDLSLTSVWMGG